MYGEAQYEGGSLLLGDGAKSVLLAKRGLAEVRAISWP